MVIPPEVVEITGESNVVLQRAPYHTATSGVRVYSARMTYHEATAWLYEQTRSGALRDPARMQNLIQQLGLTFPGATVHVAGTNGKGTVTAMIAAGLSAAGYRSGRFISPHVESFCERIAVDNNLIPPERVVDFVSRMMAREIPPAAAFFEWCFALALETFSEAQVDWAVIEAGVGVARDVTAVTQNVRLSVLTNVTLEHQETLGQDVTTIAEDKSAVIRPGVPLVTAATGEALKVILKAARRSGSPAHVLADLPLFALPEAYDDDGDPARRQNARLAAASLRLLGTSEHAVGTAVAVRLPARHEVFYLQNRMVVLDGAHNPAAARLLRQSLQRPFVLVFGALARKQGERTLRELEPYALKTLVTSVDGELGVSTTGRSYQPDPEGALLRATAECPADACVVVTGSLYLAGQLRGMLCQAARVAA
jgi:dihydrofolate synthase/folylpolyglutamate synthase